MENRADIRESNWNNSDIIDITDIIWLLFHLYHLYHYYFYSVVVPGYHYSKNRLKHNYITIMGIISLYISRQWGHILYHIKTRWFLLI
jgi:hypothetical protein